MQDGQSDHLQFRLFWTTDRDGAGHVRPDMAKDYKLFAEVLAPAPKATRHEDRKRQVKWTAQLPFVARSIVLTRDAMLVAGGKSPTESAESHGPGIFWVASREDGSKKAACALPAPPILDGMALVDSGVFRQIQISTREGPIRSGSLYDGEVYDARMEMPGWDKPGFDDGLWDQAVIADYLTGANLVWQRNEPIRVVKELESVKMTEPKPGVYVFDLGQNMVGWCRLKVHGPAGTTVTLRHAEMLNDDGTIYTANLRGAKQTDIYTKRTGGEEIYEPHFTYHGFRYVELTGAEYKPFRYMPPYKPEVSDVLGRVFHSASPDAGRFQCSSDLINKIMHMIVWVQRGNMHGIPTDCPQRDERAGWMGDIQAFSQTATTIWERWDGYVKGRGFQEPTMNSFNHWALGAVGEWMWRNIVGLNPDENRPGWKHFIIAPRPGGGLTWARGEYNSIRGTIISDWRLEKGNFRLDVTVPANTTATVYLPAKDTKSVTIDGEVAAESRLVHFLGIKDGKAAFAVNSGQYQFVSLTSRLKRSYQERL